MKRRPTPAPDLGHSPTHELPDGRRLTAGTVASVVLNGRATRTRCRFVHADLNGNLTFVDPRTGGLRTVTPDAVGTLHRSTSSAKR